jgi:hypothetical protein
MKLFRLVSTAALCTVMASVLAAQTPPPQTPTQTTPPKPAVPETATQPRDTSEMTITGCLAQDTTDPTAFKLTVAPPASSSTDAARVSSATKPATYKITGLAGDQLKSHINHQVELKGKIKASAATSRESVDAAPEFDASSVKMVSATCPPAK